MPCPSPRSRPTSLRWPTESSASTTASWSPETGDPPSSCSAPTTSRPWRSRSTSSRTRSCWSRCTPHAGKPLTATRCRCAIRCRTGLVYEVEITPEGLRHLNQLPGKVRDAAIQAMLGPIAEHPRRVGKPLVGELTGLHSARRGDYRVSYEIDDDRKVVIVHRVQHRRVVHRPR